MPSEDEIRGKPVDVRRLNIRQARAKPLLSDLRTWMEKAQHRLSSKSETTRVRSDTRSPGGRALTRYTDDGLLEIDEQRRRTAPLRAVALGRKNLPVRGLEQWRGTSVAAMYSLIGSAKLNGLDPELPYLRMVLQHRLKPTIPWLEIHDLVALETWRLQTSKTHLRPKPALQTHSTGAHQKTSGHLMTRSISRQEGLGVRLP